MTSVWIQINQKMVNTIWFRVDLTRFQKTVSACTSACRHRCSWPIAIDDSETHHLGFLYIFFVSRQTDWNTELFSRHPVDQTPTYTVYRTVSFVAVRWRVVSDTICLKWPKETFWSGRSLDVFILWSSATYYENFTGFFYIRASSTKPLKKKILWDHF